MAETMVVLLVTGCKAEGFMVTYWVGSDKRTVFGNDPRELTRKALYEMEAAERQADKIAAEIKDFATNTCREVAEGMLAGRKVS